MKVMGALDDKNQGDECSAVSDCKRHADGGPETASHTGAADKRLKWAGSKAPYATERSPTR